MTGLWENWQQTSQDNLIRFNGCSCFGTSGVSHHAKKAEESLERMRLTTLEEQPPL